MGILTTSGSFSRVIGPIGVAYVYQAYGTYWTFGTVSAILTLSMLTAVLSYRHLKVNSLMPFMYRIIHNCLLDWRLRHKIQLTT